MLAKVLFLAQGGDWGSIIIKILDLCFFSYNIHIGLLSI